MITFGFLSQRQRPALAYVSMTESLPGRVSPLLSGKEVDGLTSSSHKEEAVEVPLNHDSLTPTSWHAMAQF